MGYYFPNYYSTTAPTPITPPPSLESKIANTFHGSEIKLVIAKKLTAADVAMEKLLIPSAQIASPDFINDAEDWQLSHFSRPDSQLLATFVDPSLRSCSVFLERFRGGPNYRITNNWSLVLKNNKEVLVKDAPIRLWSFRNPHNELCFALEAGDEAGEEKQRRKEDVMLEAGRLAYLYLKSKGVAVDGF